MSSQDEKLRNLIAAQAAEWHVAHSEKALSQQQAHDFLNWLRTSPIHVAEYLTIASLANELSDAARESASPLQHLLDESCEYIPSLEGAATRTSLRSTNKLAPQSYGAFASSSRRSRAGSNRSMFRWAALTTSLLLAAAIVLAGWQLFVLKPTTETFATKHGEILSVRLPDNTLLQLDSDSTVTARFSRRSRSVVLARGQAYFRVAKDPARPFSVQAGRALFRDIGTAFDVYRHLSDTTITVAEGRVQVWSLPKSSTVSERWLSRLGPEQKPRGALVANLGAGEQAQITNTGQVTSLGKANVQQTLAWRDGRIAFDNLPIASVAAEFNRYNKVQIMVPDSRIGALPISGTFKSHDIQTFVLFLKSLPGVSVDSHTGNIVVLANRRRHRRRD